MIKYIVSHPIQYQVPLIRYLSKKIKIKVAYRSNISIKKFYEILDKWYNTKLFEQDTDKIWHEKFRIGVGL